MLWRKARPNSLGQITLMCGCVGVGGRGDKCVGVGGWVCTSPSLCHV